MNTSEQLQNITKLRLYQYAYCDEFAEYAGLSADRRLDTGVLAQEVMKVLPDAVKQTGDIALPSGEVIDKFLVVNKVSFDKVILLNLCNGFVQSPYKNIHDFYFLFGQKNVFGRSFFI